MVRDVLYLRVADRLRTRISRGEFPPGRLLPSESALAEDFAASRVTVRKALAQLKAEGLIESRQGFGWYVLAPPLRQTLRELTTIEDQILTAGHTPRRRVLSFAYISAPARPAQVLGETAVLEFTRVNLADDEPFARVTVWVPESLAADLSRRAVEHQPLHEILGVSFGGATQTISAVGASAEDAALLALPPGSPVLRCERITTDSSGRPILLSDAVFNPLVTEFVVELPALAVEPAGLRLLGHQPRL
jgi:GntR family transcriptional regulator